MFKFHRGGDGKVKVGNEVYRSDEFYEQYPEAPRIKPDVITMEYFVDDDGQAIYREFYMTPKGMKQRGTIGQKWPEAETFIQDRNRVKGSIEQERERKRRSAQSAA